MECDLCFRPAGLHQLLESTFSFLHLLLLDRACAESSQEIFCQSYFKVLVTDFVVRLPPRQINVNLNCIGKLKKHTYDMKAAFVLAVTLVNYAFYRGLI